MRLARTPIALALVLAALVACAGAQPTQTPVERRPDVPYVPTNEAVVEQMLKMAKVGKNDVIYDLGSGDGRIVITAVQRYGAARGVGIDIDPERIAEARENAQKAGVADRVKFVQGDLFTAEIRDVRADFRRVAAGYAARMDQAPRRFARINAAQSREAVWQDVLQAVQARGWLA